MGQEGYEWTDKQTDRLTKGMTDRLADKQKY